MFACGKLLDNLIIKPTYFAPILQVKEDGNFKYTRVTEYNSRWLRHDKEGEVKKPDEYESLCPFDLWMDDRWRFIRRMVGDAFCQKLFIWRVHFHLASQWNWHGNRN